MNDTFSTSLNPGLYTISTPIGNIEDITIRALKILGSLDYIVCEHRDITSKLLKHYKLRPKILPFNESDADFYVNNICNLIKNGKSVGLLSDAGTPCISDPGYIITKTIIEKNLPIFDVAGASSISTALISSGLWHPRFYFAGFLPKTDIRMKVKLQDLQGIKSSLVILESKHRILKALDNIELIFPNSKIAVCRELTKMFEEIVRGSVSEVKQYFSQKASIKGELVIILDNKL